MKHKPLAGTVLEAAVLDHFLRRPFEQRFEEPFASALFANTTDSYATSSHFTVSIVHLVDAVVVGVVDD